MLKRSKGSLYWLEFPSFEKDPHIVHGSFLRSEGLSLEKILEFFQLEYVVLGNHDHGKTVKAVEKSALSIGISRVGKCDGMITRDPHIALAVNHADCQAALFYDPKKQAIGAVHCGWRGNVKNIYGETVRMFQKTFGSSPRDLRVCISPSLGPNASQFINYEKEFPPSFYPFQFKPFYFDLWAISKWQLMELGILEEHIELSGLCTYSHPDLFYSYRRDRGHLGRLWTVIALKPLDLT